MAGTAAHSINHQRNLTRENIIYKVVVTEIFQSTVDAADRSEIERFSQTVDALELRKVIEAVNARPRRPREPKAPAARKEGAK